MESFESAVATSLRYVGFKRVLGCYNKGLYESIADYRKEQILK